MKKEIKNTSTNIIESVRLFIKLFFELFFCPAHLINFLKEKDFIKNSKAVFYFMLFSKRKSIFFSSA
jgi:hypothetical protein